MGRRERIQYALRVGAIYVVWAVLYTLIGEWAMNRETHSLETGLDLLIPFVPEFEFAYVVCYVLPLVPILVIVDRAQFNRLLAAFIAVTTIAFLAFILFPVRCPRPDFPIDSAATRLLSLEHALDRPVNNFPSLHAGVALLVFLYSRGKSRVLDVFLFLAMLGICTGALFVKQHFAADIVAGLVLSAAVSALVERRWGTVSSRAMPGQGGYHG